MGPGQLLFAEPDKFEAMVDEISKKLAGGAPLAQKMAKSLLYYGAQGDQRTGAFIETEAAASLSLTKDLNEGITSMFSRRAPNLKDSNPGIQPDNLINI